MKKNVVIVGMLFSLCVNTTIGYAQKISKQGNTNTVQTVKPTLLEEKIEQIEVEAPILDPIYAGDTQITGVIPAYGISNVDGRKVYFEGNWGAGTFSYNGKTFPNPSYPGQQLYNHQIERINDDQYRFVYTMPDYIVFKTGDKFANFIIHGSLPKGSPQLSCKLAAEMIVLPPGAKPSVTASVQVQYVDDDGNQLREPKQMTGTVGTAYDVSVAEYLLAIPGYTLNVAKLPANRTGIFTNQSQTVVYVYKKDPVEESISEDLVREDSMEESSRESSDQESTDQGSTNQERDTSESDPAATSSREKDQSSTDRSSNSNSSDEDQVNRATGNTQGDTTETTNSSSGNVEEENQLPQAGAKQDVSMSLIGSMFLLSSFFLLFNRRKKLQ